MSRERLQEMMAVAIRTRRQQIGLTQSELARRIGTGRPLVARVENGRHELTMGTLYRYATALQCVPSEIVREAERLSGLSDREAAE